MKIELTERQCFAIAKAGIKAYGTRKRFGEDNLTKIFLEATKNIPSETYKEWQVEWKEITAQILKETEPKEKAKPNVRDQKRSMLSTTPDRDGIRVWRP